MPRRKRMMDDDASEAPVVPKKKRIKTKTVVVDDDVSEAKVLPKKRGRRKQTKPR